jgi:hypothetical protein
MNALRAGINLFFGLKPRRLLTTDVTLEESNDRIDSPPPRPNRRNALHLTLSLNPVTPAPQLQLVGLGDSKGSPAKAGSVSPGFWLAFSFLKPGVLLPRLFLRRIDLQRFCPYLTGA